MPTQVTATYADVHAWGNLYLAYRKAAKGKRGRRSAASFEYKLEDNLIHLQMELADGSYHPSPYSNFTIHEPKKRLISAAPFRDRVVHHALCNLIEPAFEQSFINHSYANRKNKGTHAALDTAQKWARRYPFFLQCDIKQFFPSIDHAILQRELYRRIQDGDLRNLVNKILESGIGVIPEEYEPVLFTGDDLFAYARPRGLPIGNLTSQFWANCYMNPFDHFVTQTLTCHAYLRYVDDFILFGTDQKQLWLWRDAIEEKLANLRLVIHHKRAEVKPVRQGIPFLGFVIYPTHRMLKRRCGINYQRRVSLLMNHYHTHTQNRDQVDRSVRGWLNHARYGDTWGLRKALLREVRL